MRDCVVVGCGRSGTSLAAGLLARAGYDCGRELLPADEGSPKGFFEARGVNDVNERLLAPHDPMLSRSGHSRPLRHGERWLGVLPPGVEVEVPPGLRAAMAAALPASPYCCKDPRFGYTVDAWRGVLGEPLVVCVFRHPLATAESIARDVRYEDLRVDPATAVEIWRAVYSRILDRHRRDAEWVFVHYEQLMDGSGVERLDERLGATLDHGFADPALRRSCPSREPPRGCAGLYAELCAAAGYNG